ncbi:hypothetical protein CRG98_042121 [Punica granatum]|uniref:Alpha/beta hydrolase fold-3 domain-containing protein n=1 Tax=Punica granatum TaxID=22663 RepID=A0A2I0I0L4_PUNGR|nr:hypothetical protein CRG98_042121 [Punica granatum]
MAAEVSVTKQVARELECQVRVYTNGTIERLMGSPFVSPSLEGDPKTSVLSKGIMGRVPFEKSITIVARDLYTPSLKGLGCERVLVCVAEKDPLRDRGVWYGELVKKSGWGGELEVFEVEGEDHAFHVLYPETDNAKIMIKRLASFLMCK